MKPGKLGHMLVITALTGVIFVNTIKMTEIPKLETRVDELTMSVTVRDEAMKRQRDEMEELKVNAIEAYRGLSQQNEQLQSEVDNRDKKVKELTTKLDNVNTKLETDLKVRDGKISGLEADVDQLLKASIAKDKEIERLRSLKKTEPVSRAVSRGSSSVHDFTLVGSDFEVTWYNVYNHTASGRFVKDNVTVAVDPNVIPLGTWLKLEFPDGRELIRRADDTGGAVKGHIIDIYDNASTSDLLKRGRTHGVKVSIVKR